jgi:hypothetical protein
MRGEWKAFREREKSRTMKGNRERTALAATEKA